MPTRYHSLLIALHWIIGALIIGALIVGGVVLEDMADTPEKLPLLKLHVFVGITIGVLMVLRIAARLFTKKPPPAGDGNKALNWARRIVHFLFYVIVLSMVSTGLGIMQMSGLFETFSGAKPMPATLDVPAKIGHENFAKVLLVLILVHMLAALWHQFVRKDRLLARMGVGGAE